MLVAYSTGWHVQILSILMCAGAYYMCAHVITHALFKATLFVTLGSVIHQLAKQDCRTMSSLLLCARLCCCLWCISSSLGLCYSCVYYCKKVLADSLWAQWVWVLGCWMAWLWLITLSWSICYSISIISCLWHGTTERYASISDGHGLYNSSTGVMICGICTERNGVKAGRSMHRSVPRIAIFQCGWYTTTTNTIILLHYSIHTSSCRLVGKCLWMRCWDSSCCRVWLNNRYIYHYYIGSVVLCSIKYSGWGSCNQAPPPPCILII